MSTAAQNLLLIFKPVFLSGGDCCDLGDGRAKTVIARLGGNVRTGTGVVSCTLFIRGSNSGVSHSPEGRRWLRSKVINVDWDELPDSARFKSAVVHHLNLVGHNGSVSNSCVQCDPLPWFHRDRNPTERGPRAYW